MDNLDEKSLKGDYESSRYWWTFLYCFVASICGCIPPVFAKRKTLKLEAKKMRDKEAEESYAYLACQTDPASRQEEMFNERRVFADWIEHNRKDM